MARKRPSLKDVQRMYPSDMARCSGFTWHLGTRIGKGSFGEVYLGWSQVRVAHGQTTGDGDVAASSIVNLSLSVVGWEAGGGRQGRE